LERKEPKLPKVFIFSNSLLPYSETFIKEQALSLRRWHPVLLGHKRNRTGLDISPLQSQLLLPDDANILHKIRYAFNRWRNKPDPYVVRCLNKSRPELIHAHFGTSAVDIWPYAKVLNIPMLVTLHGFDISIKKEIWESGKRGYRRRLYPKQLLNLAKEPNVHFIAVSTAIKQRAIAFGIPADKITVHYIGIDTDKFFPVEPPLFERDNRILYVGRLVEKKGPSYLLQAFGNIKKNITNAQLVIIGKGPQEEKLKSQVAELEISDVIFTGALPGHEVSKWMNRSKIFCLPSITADNGDAEGLPIAILEAQASGLWIVTSSQGGLGDNLLPHQTCLHFDEKDVTQLTEHLLGLLSRPADFQDLIKNQQRIIQDTFDIKKCSIKLESLYDQYARLT